jgi:hypothetical protein
MSITESTTGCNFTSNTSSSPQPTGKQIRQIHKARKSQKDKALEIMKRDGSISSIQMLKMGFHSGPKRISELIKLGYIIEKVADYNKNGTKTYFYKGHKGDDRG